MYWWHLTALWTVLLSISVLLSLNLATSVPGYLDFDNLPETNFTCDGKVIGGYYADIETGCQMFHVCTIGQKGDMTDIKFLCLNGTVFDQETRVCERVDEVDCAKSKDFYDLNLELYNNGFSLPEEESKSSEDGSLEQEEDLDEEFYEDENYDTETEKVETSTQRSTTSSTTTTTTTTTSTTTTTTQRPTTSHKPNYILTNYQNKNVGTHLTGVIPNKPGSILQNKNVGTHLTGVIPQPPSLNFKYTTTTTKQPPYLNYNIYQSYPSTTQSPVATLFALQNAYNAQKNINYPDTRPIVVLNHHFPTNYQTKRKQSNPTILALQSQQKKVHKLHQAGLEIAEHRIAEITNRNAEISHLHSQREEPESIRETKEIHLGSPSIAIVTSTSSTSSSFKTPRQRSMPINAIRTTTESNYKLDLEKLFEKQENVDIEQLLLAWKLKTNKELTVNDFEKIFAKLDSSQFKNGQTISLSDIFNIMNSTILESTTRVPPKKYEDYTEEDVPLDPFYKDVPKLKPIIGKNIRYSHSRSKREHVAINATTNGQFQSRRKQKGVRVAEITVTPRSSRNRGRQRTTEKELRPVTVRPFPVTSFDCSDKVSGGLYGDVETGCEVFHICSLSADGTMIDNKFFCGNGTLFNQKSRTCQSKNLVACSSTSKYYYLNDRPIQVQEEIPEELTFEPKRINHG